MEIIKLIHPIDITRGEYDVYFKRNHHELGVLVKLTGVESNFLEETIAKIEPDAIKDLEKIPLK